MNRLLAVLAMSSAAACGSAGPVPTVEFDATNLTNAAGARAKLAPLSLTGRVVDAGGYLAPADEQALTETLSRLEQATSDQVVVVTVAGLGGESIEHYARGLGNRWKIGRAVVDNGVLFVIAPVERKVRIEVGMGLEGLLTDAKAGDAIKAMLPRFKANEYADGLRIGVGEVDRVLRSDRRRPQRKAATLRKAA